ncbi:ATP-dependent DNA helicase Q4 [Coturnix japonica]|uniref:ATP-dependent DNA helicase Q4 n=1 Tax=Coturnix japonica TaxID=93934 RepID=UPI0013A5D812|nr:ATP-dependent DNA helicase Q4 [Coturnix japonica]
MERVRELRAMLKGWETEFERENGRRPGKADVAAASEDLRRLCQEYRELKQQKEKPVEEQVSCWGSHLNRRPKAPNVSRARPAPAIETYGSRIKANVGPALQGTVGSEMGTVGAIGTMGRKRVTVRRKRGTVGAEMGAMGSQIGTMGCEGTLGSEMGTVGPQMGPMGHKGPSGRHRDGIPKDSIDLHGARPKAAHRNRPCPIDDPNDGPIDDPNDGPIDDPNDGPIDEPIDGPIDDPKPKAAHRKRLCPIDVNEDPNADPKPKAALRKRPDPIDGPIEDPNEDPKPKAAYRKRPDPIDGPIEGPIDGPKPKAAHRKRLGTTNVNEDPNADPKPKAARRKRPCPIDGPIEGNEDPNGDPKAAPKKRRTAPRPSQNLLGDCEEGDESNRVGSRATYNRAPRRPQGNFVRLNLKRRSHVKGAALRGRRLRKQVWKGKWRLKAPWVGGGGSVGRDRCFKCGAVGHWAAQCKGTGPTSQLPPPHNNEDEDEDEDGAPLPTIEEVARQTNTSYSIGPWLSTLVLLPTGLGKSLCYQLPAYLYHKRSRSVAIVVSPLVSLMDDQVSSLPPCLSAVSLHSHLPPSLRSSSLRLLCSGSVPLLLVSPEVLVGSGCSVLPPQLPPVSFACIDEAHCVSQWAHGFRPSYLRVCKVLHDLFGVRCFLALTATATSQTVQDIAAHLRIPLPHGVAARCTTVPHNLRLSVSIERDRDRALVKLLRSERYARLSSIIVYCTRREDTARVAAMLRTCLQDQLPHRNTHGPNGGRILHPEQIAAAYHAGLSASERRRVQSAFMKGRLRVVVATVAFGMGLDKADVRAVLHYNMPRSFEGYVQEIGRAGRDGETAWCHLFIDHQGSDRLELRRQVFADALDPYSIKQLVQAIFPPCKCRELQRRRLQLNAGAEVSDAEMAAVVTSQEGDDVTGSREDGHDVIEDGDDVIEEDDDVIEEEDDVMVDPEGAGEQERVCYKHERGIPIEKTVQELDVREEVSSCPPLAVALALDRVSGAPQWPSGTLQFDVVELSDRMGWELPSVKRALRGLKDQHHGSVQVQFSSLSFHVRSYGDLSPTELDWACSFLRRRLEDRQRGALRHINHCHRVLHSVAFQGCDPQPAEEEEEERSRRLKAALQEYFEMETHGHGGGEEEEDEDEGLSDADAAHVRSCLRRFLSVHHGSRFTPRSIARIFHGIGSPCYPAQIYGRDRRFWRQHLHVGFNLLTKMAAQEIIALNGIP